MEESQIDKNEIMLLIKELKQYDNEKGYKISYDKVKENLERTTKKLAEHGEECLEQLYPLLEHEETWSCLFALEALNQIKSEKSTPQLVSFIKNNEEGDYFESCEEAMNALVSIGEPAIKPLLMEIKSDFEKKTYFSYLVGALTGIKHDEVYSFMVEVLKDYIKNIENYDNWFQIEDFTYNFEVQDKKEVLPLLRKLLAMEHLSHLEKREIESTIEIVEDPEKFEKEMGGMIKHFKKLYDALMGGNRKTENVDEEALLEKSISFESKKDYEKALDCLEELLSAYPNSYKALLLEAKIKRKLGEPCIITLESALIEAKRQKAGKEVFKEIEDEKEKAAEIQMEMMSTADEELELNFKCLNCGKRQNLKPGLIWAFDGDNYVFENETMCKHCFSHELELTKGGKIGIVSQQMKLLMGKATGILTTGEYVYVENKKMKFSESYAYLLRRIEENPLNGELCLRAGNSARKSNKYEDAIKHYKKAIDLNPKLIAVYINLVEIYDYRYNYYKIKDAKDEAVFYLEKMRGLYDSRDYNHVTIPNPESIIQFLREKEADFGLSSDYKKIIEDDELRKSIRNASTIDTKSTFENIEKTCKDSKQEALELIKENKGVIVSESYHIFDQKTNESNRLDISRVQPVDPSKLCICSSGNYLKDCCFKKVAEKKVFVANTDYATYSPAESFKEEIHADKKYRNLVRGLKDDPRFYCEDENSNNAVFWYYGDAFFTVKTLGTVIFGSIKIKKKHGKGIIRIEALSKNRFDSLYNTVKEHLE